MLRKGILHEQTVCQEALPCPLQDGGLPPAGTERSAGREQCWQDKRTAVWLSPLTTRWMLWCTIWQKREREKSVYQHNKSYILLDPFQQLVSVLEAFSWLESKHWSSPWSLLQQPPPGSHHEAGATDGELATAAVSEQPPSTPAACTTQHPGNWYRKCPADWLHVSGNCYRKCPADWLHVCTILDSGINSMMAPLAYSRPYTIGPVMDISVRDIFISAD